MPSRTERIFAMHDTPQYKFGRGLIFSDGRPAISHIREHVPRQGGPWSLLSIILHTDGSVDCMLVNTANETTSIFFPAGTVTEVNS